jgi:hypothetical protein
MDLERLIETCRAKEMSPEEKEAQRRSFAYGNANISNDLITRELIDDAANAIAMDEDKLTITSQDP